MWEARAGWFVTSCVVIVVLLTSDSKKDPDHPNTTQYNTHTHTSPRPRRRPEQTTGGKDEKPKKAFINPFLPYEEALWVAHLSSTHTLLLNKFNVVEKVRRGGCRWVGSGVAAG